MKNINPHSKKSPNTTDDSTVLNNFDLAFRSSSLNHYF